MKSAKHVYVILRAMPGALRQALDKVRIEGIPGDEGTLDAANVAKALRALARLQDTVRAALDLYASGDLSYNVMCAINCDAAETLVALQLGGEEASCLASSRADRVDRMLRTAARAGPPQASARSNPLPPLPDEPGFQVVVDHGWDD